MRSLESLKQRFETELLNIYSKKEASSLFFIFIKSTLKIDKRQYYLNIEKELKESNYGKILESLELLKQNQPYQYVLGSIEFFNLRLKVNSNVLIPRPETEELIEVIKLNGCRFKNIIDIGTGSGCIALALKSHYPDASVSAIDYYPAALKVAKGNAELNDLQVNFEKVDFLNQFPEASKPLDLIVSNPPYIKESEGVSMESNVLDYEPHTALFVDDNDPLIFYKRIREFADFTLVSKGRIYLEVNALLAKESLTLFKDGYRAKVLRDISGADRFIEAIKK